jgi:Xaa-Pro aminopeptidase
MLTLSGCRERHQRLRLALAEQNIDAAVITDRLEMYYFAGVLLPSIPFALPGVLWIETNGRSWLIAPKNTAEAAVDEQQAYEWSIGSTASADWLRTVNSLLADRLRGGSVRRIGYQAEALPYLLGRTIDAAVHPDEWIAIDEVISKMQQRKDPDEIDLMRRSVQIDLAAYRAAQAAIQPGVREIDVLAAAQRGALAEAGELVYHNGDYRSGAGGGAARDRAIEAGEFYIIDAWTNYRGYWSDLSRAFIVGDEISPLQQSIFDHLKRIHEAVPNLLKPGVDGTEIWTAVNTMVREHPALANIGLTHHAGHGIGLRAHEMPDLNQQRGGTLAVGNVICVEPGGYPEAARGGVRLENMYLISENGAENLSVYPMNLR